MSRPKQSRRPPQSSSGSINTVESSAPRAQAVHEYTHHSAHSNASLPSMGSAAGVSAQERIVKSLVDKMIAKMPSYSGLSLSALEVDESLIQVHEALLQLSRHCANIIVWSLCEILDKFQKKHVGPETSLDVLESEIYIVRVLSLILNFRVNVHTEERAQCADDPQPSSRTLATKRSDPSLYSNSTSMSASSALRPNSTTSTSALVEPTALENNVAKYCLAVMLGLIRRSGPTKADALRATGKLDTLDILHEFEYFHMDNAVLDVSRSLPYDLNAKVDNAHAVSGASAMAQTNRSMASFSSGNGATSDVASHIPSAAAIRFSTFSSDAPIIITHLAGKVIFYLSGSNWPMVFSRVRNRIHYFAANMDDETLDIVDLRLLTYSGIDKIRLVQVLQELSSLLVNMKPDTQGAVAVALRTVVWKWIENYSDEFIEVIESSRRGLDGQPERVFDLLYQLMDTANKRMVWPTLAVLVSISPERLKAAEAAMNGTLKFGKKHNNYLEHLHSALTTQSRLGEIAVQCYNDICRAAFYLPPHLENTVLRSLAPDLADELKSRLMNPPFPMRPFYDSLEPIDVTLYADTLVVILRYHPMVALANVLPECLESERSAAVKLCVVRALTILVTEAMKFPWQSSLDKSIYNYVAPKLRAAMMDLAVPRNSHYTTRPLSTRDGPPTHPGDDRKELILSIHALWRLDFGFFFSNMVEGEYKPLIDSFLMVLQPPKDEAIQVSTLRTIGAFLAKVNTPQDEYFDLVNQFMYHAGAATLLSAAEELVSVTDDYEETHRCMNLVVAILSQMADRTVDGRQAWKYTEQRNVALEVVQTALILHLASPRLELCALAAKAVRLMTIIEQDPEAQPSASFAPEQGAFPAPLFEALGDPRTVVLGRVEFQKRMRSTCSVRAFPCVSHLGAWREAYFRWVALKPFVSSTGARSSTDILASNGSLPGSQTFEEKQMEWENLTLALASAAGACMSDDPALNAPAEYRFPFRKDITDQQPSVLVSNFIRELTELLTNAWVPARTIARDALGIELNPKMLPFMFDHLDFVIKDMFGEESDYFERQEQDMVVFVDQVISILKLTLDRAGDAEELMQVDLGENLQALARFIHRGEPNTSERRIKARFCALIDNLLEKRDTLRIRQESVVRNNLLDIVADWVLEYPNEWPEDDMTRNEQVRAQRDSNLAALKTCVNLLDNLRLHAHDGSTGSDSAHVVSRLFHRYFNIFVTALAPRTKESETMIEFDQMSQQSTFGTKHDALVQELVISGISNMLHANTDAGTKHVLTLGYKDNPRLRAVFAHVFCRVLSRGTKFDNYLDGVTRTSRKSRLCEMVKESEIIAQAIIDVCPMSDIDTIVPVLLNIYDTRKTLLNLLRMIIRRQVEITSSDTELFRSNDMCSRILSAFAKIHGYNYLRSITIPLTKLMLELPPEGGYELDPTKLRPGETPAGNAENLTRITKAFLAVISDSVNAIPSIIREVCRYILEEVTAVWPESRYAAIGAFIFLRFIVPAIVAPETVDIEIPRNDPRAISVRRGLLLVAKIIQNLANNILFGKEAHMTMLNPFLQANIGPVTRFHNEILKMTPDQAVQNPDEWLGSSYDETDTIILHRFFQKNADKVGKVLLSLSRMTNSHEVMNMSGKRTWDTVCSLLVEMGAAMEPPTVSDQPSTQHKAFRAFMLKNGHRNTDSVREIFQSTISLKDQRSLFILTLSRIDVETVDLELLMCHIFKTIKERTAFEQPFDVIIDCTAFTSASEVPISWCKLYLDHLPSDLRITFETAYIVNSNAAAQKFLRKLYHVCTDVKFPNSVIAFPSIAELAEVVHPASLTPMSYSSSVESESSTEFACHQHQRNQIRTPVIMNVGISHIRITSAKTQPIYPNLYAKSVEIIPLVDIGDVCIVSSRNDTTDFLIRRTLSGGNVTFSSPERDEIVKVVRLAKSRFQASRPLIPAERSPRLADISAALLNVGLLNVCDEDESLRGVAYDLLFAVCAYVNYEANPLVPLRGPFVPSNTAAFILPFSERLASFVPQLTLDLISEFALGFEKASTAQKITCLQYLNPWIKNLVMFAKPTDPNYDHSGGKIRDSIRTLIDITVKFPEVYPTLQRSVWTELGKHDSSLLNIALDELMRAAIDGGLGSARCEQIADTLIAMSTINIRAKVINKLRRVLAKASSKTTRSLSQSPTWNEITALSRLALVAGYSTRLTVQNLMFVPEIAHLTTMLCSTGSSNMKRTIYGIAMSLVQSLHIARSEEAGSAKELKKILDDASHPDTLQKFGLVRTHASSEYISIEYPPDQIPMEALEGITELLIQALTYGAQSIGLLNVWRGRWMSLVTATAFQICPYIQYRAFTVLGLLASSDNAEVDDDLLYQMLVAFKNALSTSGETEPGPATSMLRCMAKVIPGIGADSRYLPQVFWLAVALLQSTYLPLYGEAARLLEVTLEVMARQGLFRDRRMSEVLLEARIPLTETTTQLDTIMGLSFETGFSFSLASIIFRGVRPPAVRPIAQRLLKTILRIAADSSAEQMEIDSDTLPVPLDHDILGYFLALLPFAYTSGAYRELLKEARVGTRWWPPLSQDEEDDGDDNGVPRVSTELFGFSPEDRNTPLLVISFTFAMLNSYQGSEQEKEFLFSLLAQLGQVYPELCASAVVHYLVNPRPEWLLSNLTETFIGSAETASAVQVLFRIAMTSPAWSAATSSTMPTSETDSTAGQRTPHYRALEELDMHALSGMWQFLPKGNAEKVLQWIPLLVDAIIE